MDNINLGATILRDYRSISHDEVDELLGSATSIPESQISDINWLIVNLQQNTPMCGPHSGTHLKALMDNEDTGKNRYSPAFLWRAIKTLDGFAPNQGTSIEAIFKALKEFGICDWDILPTDFTLSEQDQAYTKLTDAQKDNAQPRIIKAYAVTYNPTNEQVREILAKYKYVILLLQFDGAWWSGSIHHSNGTKKYGHFVCSYGYDKDYIYVIDSADAINKYKKLSNTFSIKAIGSAVDLPDAYVKSLVDKKRTLQKVVDLWRQLKNLMNKK